MMSESEKESLFRISAFSVSAFLRYNVKSIDLTPSSDPVVSVPVIYDEAFSPRIEGNLKLSVSRLDSRH